MKKDIFFKNIQDFYVFTNMFVRIRRELLRGRYSLKELINEFENKDNIANIFKDCFREINKKGKLMDDNNMTSITLSLSDDQIKMCKIFVKDSLEELINQLETETELEIENIKELFGGRENMIYNEINDYKKLNEIITKTKMVKI